MRVGRGSEEFLYLSEWVLMAKHSTTKGWAAFKRLRDQGLLDAQEIADREHGYALASAFPLFPELDEQGDCIVEGLYKEGPINRTPAPCGTCGGNKEIEGGYGQPSRIDCPECVSGVSRG